MKTVDETRGIYYEQQMYQMLKEVYTYIYVEGEASLEIPNQREARENIIRLRRFVKLSLAEARGTVSMMLQVLSHNDLNLLSIASFHCPCWPNWICLRRSQSTYQLCAQASP